MFERQQHFKVFLQEVGLEHGDVEKHMGLSMSTTLKAALKFREETAVFMQNNGKLFSFYEFAMLCDDICSNWNRGCRGTKQVITQMSDKITADAAEIDPLGVPTGTGSRQDPVCQSISASPERPTTIMNQSYIYYRHIADQEKINVSGCFHGF